MSTLDLDQLLLLLSMKGGLISMQLALIQSYNSIFLPLFVIVVLQPVVLLFTLFCLVLLYLKLPLDKIKVKR